MSRGAFYLRAESEDWDFADRLGDTPPLDGVIICDRYLAEYPQGHRHYGQPRDRLAVAFEDRGISWRVDPDTARLAHPRSGARQSARDGLRPQAKVLPVPITPEILSDPENLDALLEAAAFSQTGSSSLAVPYFEPTSLSDPLMSVNLALIARARQFAGDRELVSYLQILISRVRDGVAAEMLRQFVDAGADAVMIRVRGLTPEAASVADAEAYARLVHAGASQGARVVADCTGRLGPMLIAAGAYGFSSGVYRFRTIPGDLHPTSSSGGGGDPLTWEMPGGGAAALGTRVARSCAIRGCEVANSGDATGTSTRDKKRANEGTRVHNCHTFQSAGRVAARMGLGYASVLLQSSDAVVRSWAGALQALERRAA